MKNRTLENKLDDLLAHLPLNESEFVDNYFILMNEKDYVQLLEESKENFHLEIVLTEHKIEPEIICNAKFIGRTWPVRSAKSKREL